jgi:hypothetical protein
MIHASFPTRAHAPPLSVIIYLAEICVIILNFAMKVFAKRPITFHKLSSDKRVYSTARLGAGHTIPLSASSL